MNPFRFSSLKWDWSNLSDLSLRLSHWAKENPDNMCRSLQEWNGSGFRCQFSLIKQEVRCSSSVVIVIGWCFSTFSGEIWWTPLLRSQWYIPDTHTELKPSSGTGLTQGGGVGVDVGPVGCWVNIDAEAWCGRRTAVETEMIWRNKILQIQIPNETHAVAQTLMR